MVIREWIKLSRPTWISIDPKALVHNVSQVRAWAPNKKIIAMVKANAYGCGLSKVVPVLDGLVDYFGVACMEEALAIRSLGSRTPCLVTQGVFCKEEYSLAVQYQISCVLHHTRQLEWLLETPLVHPVSLWVKVNTGMHRLGFEVSQLQGVLQALQGCEWVHPEIPLMTHLACADEPERQENSQQMALFHNIKIPGFSLRSMANSAAILALPEAHADAVRPGIMLYGVSPFPHQSAALWGLKPVMRFLSSITVIHHYPPFACLGYGGTWHSPNPSIIGLVAVGYGDGYPKHIAANTPVWVRGREVPIVGRVSMDLLSIDLTHHPEAQLGDEVELWGPHIAVERIAKSAGTIGYELLCQVTDRVRN